MLNNAYTTLKDPVERSKYLLELQGIEYGEDVPAPSTDFLMEVMEIREEIETTSDFRRLKSVQEELIEKQKLLEEELLKCYRTSPTDSSQVIDYTSKLIYVNKMLGVIYDRLPPS